MPILQTIRELFTTNTENHNNLIHLPTDIIQYAATSYPSNHTYHIANGKLTPLRKLRKRYNTLSKLYPQPVTSLLDIGCSKGYFVLAQALHDQCQRALGIDITQKEIHFCNQVKAYLNTTCAQFELMQLDQLAGRIHEFGGPYQTVLVVNLYQYLFFGSDQYSGCYLNHDMIFKYLSDVCSQRIIFNNRVTLADCQNQIWIEQAGAKGLLYSEEHIYNAASNYFHIKKYGTYGRYPLWTLEKKY